MLPGAHRKLRLACLNNFTGRQEEKLVRLRTGGRRLVQLMGELVGGGWGNGGSSFSWGMGISGERARTL